MTTPRNATEAAAQAFAGFDVLEGFTPIDKAELVGVPFGITAIRFRENERKIVYAEAEIVNADGEPFGIQDSSTGLRDQLRDYLVSKGLPVGAEWVDVRLMAPNGLRVSTYEVTDDRGRNKTAKTYYLTLAPRTREPANGQDKAPAKGGTKAA